MRTAVRLSVAGLMAAAGAAGVAWVRQPEAPARPAAATPAAPSPSAPQSGDPGLLMHFSAVGAGPSGEGTTLDVTGKVRAKVVGNPRLTTLGPSEGIRFNGTTDWLVISDDIAKDRSVLPAREFTASAWVSLAQPDSTGAVLGCQQDGKQGWSLGFHKNRFVLSLATKGAARGRMTHLAGKTELAAGRWYHVAGVYDGAAMRLYVNGKLDAESADQSGEIAYPASAPFTVAALKEKEGALGLNGTLLEVKLFGRAADPAMFVNEAAAGARLLGFEPPTDSVQRFIAKPYLQFGTKTGMTLMWETSQPGQGWVEYTEALPFDQKTGPGSLGTMHEVRIEGLKPETQYFWRAHTTAADGADLAGDVLTFQTAVNDQTPFMFVAIGDTQKNLPVIQKLQDFAYSLRPNMEIHLGDIVDEGPNKMEWTKELLPGSWTLMSRVAMYPAIGNHEKNHSLYYQYVSVPDPEYYYTYTYGNAQFFSIDTNKPVDEQSEQYKWLDAELGKSTAVWKFVYHHHPVYSSDEDDFGDTYKGKSTFGDPKYRVLAPLFEKHKVDIDFNGHVHCYERTWPLYQGKVDEDRGVIYLTTGGGGGGLESAGPSRTWFAQRVYRGHHITSVMINQKHLVLQAFDLEGRLFDTMEIRKK